MKTVIKIGKVVVILGIIALVVGALIKLPNGRVELEIYTLENIYYVDGRVVTNENNNDVYTFKTSEQLFEYISRVTVEDNLEGYECLEERYGK